MILSICTRITLPVFTLCVGSWCHAETRPAAFQSLVSNGGFEEIRDVDLTGGYFLSALKRGVRFSGRLFGEIPKNFDQFSGKSKHIMIVEGKPGIEVHSGKRALRIDGGFYLIDQFDVRTGDVFFVRFYARGKAKARFIFFLMNSKNQYFAQGVPNYAKVDSKDAWFRVTHRVTIEQEDCHRSKIRYEGIGDLTIDDLVVVHDRDRGKVDKMDAERTNRETK